MRPHFGLDDIEKDWAGLGAVLEQLWNEDIWLVDETGADLSV